MATMRDVALRADVSTKTVSRVLRNDRYVSQSVRERVLQAASELQYVPNMLAVTFRNGRDAAIGVAVPDIADPFFAQLIKAVEVEAAARQTAVIVTSLGTNPDHEQAAVELLLQRQVMGLISCPVSKDQSYLVPWLQRTQVVFVDRAPAKIAADFIIEDNFGGAHVATSHLMHHGHRRIAFIGDASRSPTTSQRLEGYKLALAEDGIAFDDALVYLGETDQASLRLLFDGFASLAEPPSAVFSSNPRCSLTIFPALKQLEGSGLALVSFGDFAMADSLDPAVTVIDQDPSALGKFAVERLFLRMADPAKRRRRRNVLPVSLIERQSCRRPVGPVRNLADGAELVGEPR